MPTPVESAEAMEFISKIGHVILRSRVPASDCINWWFSMLKCQVGGRCLHAVDVSYCIGWTTHGFLYLDQGITYFD